MCASNLKAPKRAICGRPRVSDRRLKSLGAPFSAEELRDIEMAGHILKTNEMEQIFHLTCENPYCMRLKGHFGTCVSFVENREYISNRYGKELVGDEIAQGKLRFITHNEK